MRGFPSLTTTQAIRRATVIRYTPVIALVLLLLPIGCQRPRRLLVNASQPGETLTARSLCATNSGSEDVSAVRFSAVSRELDDFRDSARTRALAADTKRFLDRFLAATWYARYYPNATYLLRRVPVPGRKDVMRRYLCALYSGEPLIALDLGVAPVGDSTLEPFGLRQLMDQMIGIARDSIWIFRDAAVSSENAESVADSLRLIERAFGLGAPRPTSLFLFGSRAVMGRAMPERYLDAQPGSRSLAMPDFPGAAFIHVGSMGLASHELVHLVVSRSKVSATRQGTYIRYFAEEALAQGIGGTSEQTFHQIANSASIGAARRRISATLDSSIRMDTLPMELGTQPPQSLDVLGALYRVALVRCARFPDDLLFQRYASDLRVSVKRLARHLGLREEEVLELAASELAVESNVLVRASSASNQRSACH
jgi:hypothetical protein